MVEEIEIVRDEVKDWKNVTSDEDIVRLFVSTGFLWIEIHPTKEKAEKSIVPDGEMYEIQTTWKKWGQLANRCQRTFSVRQFYDFRDEVEKLRVKK